MTVRRQKFYQITVSNENRVADIIIYGDITSFATDLTRWYGDDENISEVASRQIIKEIKDLDVDMINVYINSYGGEVAEALAIYSALKRHSASVHTYCDGFACSAATIIFCAGDVRTMGSIALMMIHNCMSYLGYANSEEMRKAAEDNDKINQSSINAYLAVSNLSEDKIREMMNAETWITAQEALEYGFATEIADQDPEEDPQQSAFPILRNAVLRVQEEDRFMKDILAKIDQLVAAQQLEEDPDEDEDPDDEEPEQRNKLGNIFKLYLSEEEE